MKVCNELCSMPYVPLCDILSVAVSNRENQYSSSMRRQSTRIKSKQVLGDNDEGENRMKNGYAVNTFYGEKPSIDILSKVKSENAARKRKGNFASKIFPDQYKPHATKQIKVEDHSQEDNLKVEDNGQEGNLKVENGQEDDLKVEDNEQEDNLENLSEYEKMCRKNIEEKMAFFASLNFDQAKQDFLTATSALKPKAAPRKLHIKKTEPVTSRRKSLRLQKIDPEGLPLPPSNHPLIVTAPAVEERPKKPHGPLTFEEVFKTENQSSENLIKDLSKLSTENLKFETYDFSRYESYFSSMKITSASVAKVAPSRIFSVAVHPSRTKTLICAGSKYGHLSFWDVESKNQQGGVYVYEPHSTPVCCIAFHASHPHEVVSSSYDGTVRCGHLEAGIFDEVFFDDDDERCSYFDFLSPDSLLVALSSGEIAVADMRTRRDSERIRHRTHPCPVKTVSIHPVQKNYFIAAGRNGIVSLWDLRSIKKKSIADMVHSRSVSSAFFSPVTGNSVLTTSMDDKLSLFDTANLDGTVCLKKAIRHNNFTGRWLTVFQAVWLPSNEDAFVVGSMDHPRRIEVYQTNGKLAHNFFGEDLGSVCSINAFHPSKPVLAGGNSSGRVHIFKGNE